MFVQFICFRTVLSGQLLMCFTTHWVFYCSLSQSLCPQHHRGCLWFRIFHAPVAFHSVLHLFVQHLLGSSDLCSPLSRRVSVSMSPFCFFVFVLLSVRGKKKSRYINKIGDYVSKHCTLCTLTPGVPLQLSRWPAVKQHQYLKHFTHRRLIVFADIRLEVIIFAMHITEFFVIPVYTHLGKTTTTTKNIKKQKN